MRAKVNIMPEGIIVIDENGKFMNIDIPNELPGQPDRAANLFYIENCIRDYFENRISNVEEIRNIISPFITVRSRCVAG